MAYTIETVRGLSLVTTDTDGDPVTTLSGAAGDMIQDNFVELGNRTEGRRFNVRSYGAVGDGTTDDQEAIQAAIDACATAGGGEVYIPAGTWRIEDELEARDYISIVGDGMDQTIIEPHWEAVKSAIKTDTNETRDAANPHVGFHMRDLTIECENADYTSYSTNVKGIYIKYMQDCTFTRVRVNNSWGSAFGIDFLVRVSLTNCIADGSGAGLTDPDTEYGGNGFGIGMGFGVDQEVNIVGCHAINCNNNGYLFEAQTAGINGRYVNVTGCTGNANYRNVRISGVENINISGCLFEESDAEGIYISGSTFKSTVAPAKISIVGTQVSDSGSDGIALSVADLSAGVVPLDIVISGCVIKGNTDHGIQIDGCDRTMISGNMIFGNGGGGDNGILLNPSRDIDNLAIKGNQIYANSGYGIRMGATGAGSLDINNCIIQGNQIYDIGSTQDGPILMGQNASVDYSGCQIIDNQFYGHTSSNNDVDGSSSLAATEVFIARNSGHNPVGFSSITVGSSPFAHTAGTSNEHVYIKGGTVTNIVKEGTSVATATDANIPVVVALDAGETLTVTYSVTPTMKADIH